MIEEEKQDDSTLDESESSDETGFDSAADDDNFEYDDAARFASIELDEEEVPETDITFECPHCGKYLSIDPRGAGLVIPCTQCGKPVTVPIPEGLEIDDFDATPEELSIQLLSARQNLAKAQAHVSAMEQELDELRAFKDASRKQQEEHAALCERIRIRLSEAASLQGDANSIIRDVAAMLTTLD